MQTTGVDMLLLNTQWLEQQIPPKMEGMDSEEVNEHVRDSL